MSINEIAKHLKVSKSTVSQVINGKAEQARISKRLAKRILDYVEEIGYKPNALAKSLATGKSKTIGLIVENIGDSFFGPIALYIEECLRAYEYHVLYSSTLGDSDMAANIVQTMVDKQVEGIILSPTENLEQQVARVIATNIPLVIFDRKIPGLKTNYIGTNNLEASKEAIEHLYQGGFQSIGMITIDSTQPQMQDRLQAYKNAVNQRNHTVRTLSMPYPTHKVDMVERIQGFLAEHPELDALYFSTNYLCVAGLKAIQLQNNKKRYGMISFDDHELFELLQPTISCIYQPLEEIAKQIVQVLIAQIEDADQPFTEQIIPSSLIIRQSSK